MPPDLRCASLLCLSTRDCREGILSVKHLSPAYFALVMATGVISIAAWDFGFAVLANGLFAFNFMSYVVLACLTVLRAVRYPGLFFADMTDHRLGPGFFTSVAASCILGNQFLLIARSLAAATIFLALGTALWISLTYTIFTAFTVKQEKPPLEKGLTGAWLIAVVSTQSIAVLAALVASEWPQPLRLELNFFSLSMWLWGGMLYIWIISLIFYRYTFFAFSPGDLAPPYWINMGAMAISTLAGARLVQNRTRLTRHFSPRFCLSSRASPSFTGQPARGGFRCCSCSVSGGIWSGDFPCAMTRFIGGQSFRWACIRSRQDKWLRPLTFHSSLPCRPRCLWLRWPPGCWLSSVWLGNWRVYLRNRVGNSLRTRAPCLDPTQQYRAGPM